MGTGTSKQRLGERVLEARKKLEAVKRMQSERTERIKATSPDTLEVMVQNITDSFERCSPFPDSLLLVAFEANPEEVERILAKSCKKVMCAPIAKDEYDWFMRYVFPSPVWMMQNKRGEYLYERMMTITQSMSQKIDNSMDAIFKHLVAHSEWENVVAIQNQTVVERQDDERWDYSRIAVSGTLLRSSNRMKRTEATW